MGDSLESPLTEAKMWQALELAQAKDFVEAKEGGLAEHVPRAGPTSRGVNVNVWPLPGLWRVSQKS